MRNTFPVLSAMCLALFAPAALAQDSPRTVSDYANAMNDVAARLDVQITVRQKAGDMAAAQRLVLAAAMVRRAAEEFRGAEQDSLNDAVSGLPAPVRERLSAAFAKVNEAEKLGGDQPAFVDEAQRAFNALIAALPEKTPHPVVYGLLSRDLTADKLASDIVIYGYRLVDPIYKTNPVVLYGRTEIASAVVHDDRIDVTLPDDVKKAVDFSPPPCDSRASFGIRVRNSYAQRRGFWPVAWHTEVLTNADFYALPTPVFYTARISTIAEIGSEKTSTVPFQEKSGLAAADCDRTSKVEVVVPLPAHVKNVTCAADWVRLSGAAKMSSHCATDGGAVRAVGEITAGAQVCSPDKLCACPVPAEGFLEAKGSYEIEESAGMLRVEGEAAPVSFAAGGMALGRVAVGPKEKLRHVALSLSRRACPTPVDSIDLNIGDDPDARVTGVSKTGAFRAEIKGTSLSVGAADVFAADIDKTP